MIPLARKTKSEQIPQIIHAATQTAYPRPSFEASGARGGVGLVSGALCAATVAIWWWAAVAVVAGVYFARASALE